MFPYKHHEYVSDGVCFSLMSQFHSFRERGEGGGGGG